MDVVAVILPDVVGPYLNPERLVLAPAECRACEHQAWLSRTHGVQACWDGPTVNSKGLALTVLKPWCFHFSLDS